MKYIYFEVTDKTEKLYEETIILLLLTTAVVGRAQTSLDLLPVGTEAPDFTITDSKTGKKIFQLSDKKTQKDKDGKTVPGVWTVLDFWASWCPDCRRDMPMVKAIYDKYNTKIQVVGVSFDTDEAKMKKYLGDNQYTWLQYCEFKKWKETKISKDYHISWIPTSYLINPEGKIAFSTVKAEEMMKKLDSLDQAGALKPAQVQTALKKVYNESIDPMAQIDEALAKARKNGKFVICQVGGNWCPWCLKFAYFVEKNVAVNKMVNDHFEYIHVNYNRRKTAGDAAVKKAEQLMKRLNNPQRFGFPVFVVLDETGKVLHIQDSSFLEEGKGYNEEKVLRFLKSWTPQAVKDKERGCVINLWHPLYLFHIVILCITNLLLSEIRKHLASPYQ